MRALLLCCVLLAACSSPPAATIPLVVDGSTAGEIVLPAGPGPWPLAAHVPPGTPPFEAWARVLVEGADGASFSRRSPAAHAETEDARFYLRKGEVAFAVFLRAGEGASDALKRRAVRPSLAVAAPVRVTISTK